jgi:hypothetical protein
MYQINNKTLTIKEKVSKKLEQAYNLLSTAVYLITGYATYDHSGSNIVVSTAGVIVLMIAIYRIVSISFKDN